MTITEPQTGPNEAWREAGKAWEHAAEDWAFLFEPYARDAIDHIFNTLGVGEGVDLFDMACGSGYAVGIAERRGARAAGLDAAEGLVDIARIRAPESDLHAGDMFALPFDDSSFDVVTSFNGIWGGCDDAVAEAARVLRPGGALAITFWGPGHKLDLRDFFIALGRSTPVVGAEMIDLASIGANGVAEQMFIDAGFTDLERGATSAIQEFANADMAWRCLRSPGLVLPALEAVGEEALRATVLDAIEPFRTPGGGYRLVNELTHVIGRKAV
jgi:SAM-dependent methyltransferase